MAKPPTTPPPRWACRDKKEQHRFEAWTLARLDEEDAHEMDNYDPALDPWHIVDPKSLVALEKDASERLKRGRVIVAARARDHDALVRLADTEDLRRLAFRPHKRGREKGERRPRDLPDIVRAGCEEALFLVERIRDIWQNEPTYGKRNRTLKPTAIESAARRCAVDSDTLVNFKKNRPRRP